MQQDSDKATSYSSDPIWMQVCVWSQFLHLKVIVIPKMCCAGVQSPRDKRMCHCLNTCKLLRTVMWSCTNQTAAVAVRWRVLDVADTIFGPLSGRVLSWSGALAGEGELFYKIIWNSKIKKSQRTRGDVKGCYKKSLRNPHWSTLEQNYYACECGSPVYS